MRKKIALPSMVKLVDLHNKFGLFEILFRYRGLDYICTLNPIFESNDENYTNVLVYNIDKYGLIKSICSIELPYYYINDIKYRYKIIANNITTLLFQKLGL